jgi:isopenicillin-N epimerase
LPYDSATVVDRLMAAVGPRTRLVYASHLTSTTALVLPVAALCTAARARGVATLIDGAHAPGQLDLDLTAIGADFYVGNGHKWLCAPKGAGFLHARPEWHATLNAPVISWGYAQNTGGHSGFDAYLGRTLLERRMQWQGTRDISAWLSVPAALDFQARHGWSAVRRACHQLAAQAQQVLLQRYGLVPLAQEADWAQMVAIPVPKQDPDRLRRRLLEESQIEIPVTSHGGQVFVRLSIQGYNTPADVDRLLEAPALR